MQTSGVEISKQITYHDSNLYRNDEQLPPHYLLGAPVLS